MTDQLLESLDHMRKQALFIPISKLSNIELIAGGSYNVIYDTIMIIVLHAGHFGTQYTAELSQKPSGQRIKVVMKAVKKPLSQKENFIKDQAIIADMIHPNIVRFFGVVDQGNESFNIIPLAAVGAIPPMLVMILYSYHVLN